MTELINVYAVWTVDGGGMGRKVKLKCLSETKLTPGLYEIMEEVQAIYFEGTVYVVDKSYEPLQGALLGVDLIASEKKEREFALSKLTDREKKLLEIKV